jgi:hypothetical protein
MQKLIVVFYFSILTLCLQAQNNYDHSFDRLEPVGEMPDYFKQILQKTTISPNVYPNNLKQLDEQFVFSLLMNGKILYGDPVTQYLNQLLDKILEHKPDLRKDVQIYALKSEQVNAFSTPMGTIFVNLGLIAHCSNEAELAFVICHELAHYAKSHTEDKLKTDPAKIKDIDVFLKYHSQSRELELHADKYGFLDFFKDLGYNFDVFEDVFDMLQYADLPFGNKEFTRAFFENEYYNFNDNYFPAQTNPVTFRDNYVDTLSSHPNILNRRLEMRKIVGQFSYTNTSKVTAYFEKQFNETKMLAQFEAINQLIIKNNYLYAYYNACALQDMYPHHSFLKQTEAAALYALCRLKITGNYKNNVAKTAQLPGEIQFPATVLERMNKKELTVWSLRTVWKALQTNLSNDYLTQIFNDLVKEVVSNIGSLNQFCDYRMTDTLIVEQITDTSSLNKGRYDRYKEKVTVTPSPQFKVENYMLADLKQNPDFLDAFALGILTAEKTAVNNLILKYRKKSKEKIPIIVFQPALELKEMLNSEKKIQRQTPALERDCKNIAKSCRFAPQIISSTCYDTTYSYPVYVRLIELEKNITTIIPVAYETRQSGELYNALGTPYINYIVVSKIKSGYGGGTIIYNIPLTALSVFLYPVAPFAVLSWIPQRYNANMIFVLYDLQQKKYIQNTVRSFKISDKSEFYQTLYENYSTARKNIKE